MVAPEAAGWYRKNVTSPSIQSPDDPTRSLEREAVARLRARLEQTGFTVETLYRMLEAGEIDSDSTVGADLRFFRSHLLAP